MFTLVELLVAAIGMLAVPTVAVSALVASSRRRSACPACHEPGLQVVGVRRVFANGASIERMFRCRECKADFMQLAKGPLVPKAEWDAAGAATRATLPAARIVHRRDRDA